MTICFHVWCSSSCPAFRDQGTAQFIGVVPALKLEVAAFRVRLDVSQSGLHAIFVCRTLLSIGGTIGGLFLPVKAYLGIQKSMATDAVGNGRWNICRSFEKSAHRLVESPGKKAFLSIIQAGLSYMLLFKMRYDCL
jgi:hypothetical protein